MRFFFDFLLFLALVPVDDSDGGGSVGADADGVPPSLSFVSPSSLSAASTGAAGCGVGGAAAGIVDVDFFFSSPSESYRKQLLFYLSHIIDVLKQDLH